MEKNIIEQDRYQNARKRVKELKGFYWHLFWYVAVNLFISISKILSDLSDGESFNESFFEFGTFTVWIFWGIGLLSHGLGVFGKNFVFSKDWESRKIKKYMDRDKQNWN